MGTILNSSLKYKPVMGSLAIVAHPVTIEFLFYHIHMDKIDLPTYNDENEYIDAAKFEWTFIFTVNDGRFVHCFINKVLYFVILSKGLERWIGESGINLFEFGNIPAGGKIVEANNIPERFRNA